MPTIKLYARSDNYETVIKVVPPTRHGPEDDSIKAVILLTTDLPKELSTILASPEMMSMANSFAGLGALCRDGERVYVGSRLTVYESPDAWTNLELPLLLFATLSSVEAITGALLRAMNEEPPRSSAVSNWTESDFQQVEKYLSRMCVCATGGLGFTAEFGLSDGAVSAAAGHTDTALFQLFAEEPHPELGNGLTSLLQMPHAFDDHEQLLQACEQMNGLEMAPVGLPPHFGAWCPGRSGINPAYISFYPNALHSVDGLDVNAAIWAMNRAEWANEILAEIWG